MMTLKTMIPLAAVTVCGLVCGCVEPRARYVDPGEIVVDASEVPTMIAFHNLRIDKIVWEGIQTKVKL